MVGSYLLSVTRFNQSMRGGSSAVKAAQATRALIEKQD